MANFLREHSQGTYYDMPVTTYIEGRVKSARHEKASIKYVLNEGGGVGVIKPK